MQRNESIIKTISNTTNDLSGVLDHPVQFSSLAVASEHLWECAGLGEWGLHHAVGGAAVHTGHRGGGAHWGGSRGSHVFPRHSGKLPWSVEEETTAGQDTSLNYHSLELVA